MYIRPSNAPSHSEPNGRSRYLATAVSAILTIAAASAHAGPHNGVVTNGSATISTPSANLTQIDQASRSASIDWQSFDVGAQERVIFNQPSASSVALNRIHGQDPSQIYGSIAANGRVFLINPNGIIFGASARINVGSLVASSLDLTDADADSGHYAFAAGGRSGAILNNGRIVAADGGSVALLGGSVVNNGLIVANFGSVNLAAGRAATLDFTGDGLFRFQVDAGLLADESGASAAVDNAGEIVANGGQVLLTARQANDVIARAVNNDGVIRASRIDNSGGRIRLIGPEGGVVNSGTLDASGAGATSTGGEVQVLGSQVKLSGTSLIDASGNAGGGTVQIGGSFGGADATVLNSRQTDVDSGAMVRADSLSDGDAGQVVLWSDGTTTFNGAIYARALGAGGNGGQVEVSGREHLGIGGHAWLGSTYGNAGKLLLDPGAITIVDGNSNPPDAPDLDIVHDRWINDELDDHDVQIKTSSSNSANPVEDLLVASDANINWNNGNSLTLNGGASVKLATGSTITNTGSGSLTLQSGGVVAVGGTITLAGGLSVIAADDITQTVAMSVGGAASFTTAAGKSVALDDSDNSFGGAITIGGGTLADVTLRNSTAIDLQALSLSGNLTVEAGTGDITQAGALNVGGVSSFTVIGGQSIVLDRDDNLFNGAVTVAASSGKLQDVTLHDSSLLDLQALSINGDLDVAATSLTQSGALDVDGSAIFTVAGGQSILLSDPTNLLSGPVSFAASTGSLNDVTLFNAVAVDLHGVTLNGDLAITANGGITQSGALLVGGASSFTAANGQSIVLGDAGNAFTGTVSLFASSGALQNVTLLDSTALQLQTQTINGDLTASSGAALTQSGALVIGGNSAFTAASGESIMLDNAGNSFAGTVNFAAGGGTNLLNVTVNDIGALDLRALSVDGALSATSGGALTQSGAMDVGGAASFRTLNDTGAGITLAGTNSFGSVQAAVRNAANTADAGASIVIHENNATSLGNMRTAAGQSVSVTSAGAITALAGTALTTGSVALDAGGDIGTAGTAVSVTAPNGSISALSTGSVHLAQILGAGTTVALSQVVAGNAGDIDVVSDGNIRVADVRAGGSVTLTSTAGSILDDNVNGVGSRIVADDLTLQAAGSVGQAQGVGSGLLDLQVASVTANAQAGGIHIDQSQGDLNVRQLAATGAVTVQAGAGSILDDPSDLSAASIASTTGGIQLSALNNIGTVADLPTRAGSPILINANGGAIGAHVGDANGQVNLAIAGGSSLTAGVGAISAGGSGRLLIQSTGDLTLGTFQSAIAGFSEVGFSSEATLRLPDAAGQLIAGPVTTVLVRGATDVVRTGRVFDLTAEHLVFQSGGLGGDVTLNTNVGLLDASIGNGASLSVVQGTGALTLGTIGAGNNVSIRAASIVDDGDINGITQISAPDTISLHADGSIGAADDADGGRIDTTSQSVSLLADAGSAFLSHLGDLQLSGTATGGSIDVAAATGSITVNTALRAAGPLTLVAGTDGATAGNITLAGTAQSEDAAVLTALGGGAIADANDGAVHLTAKDTVLSATLIGSSANALSLNAASLGAIAPNGVYVNASGAVQLRSIAGADVVIAAAGNITDDGDAQTRITGASASLSGAAIGAAGAANEIDTSVDRLSVNASNGGIYIGQTGNVQLGTVSAAGAGNDIAISATGAITDDGDSSTRIAGGNLVLNAASIGGAALGSEMETQVASLNAAASAGGIYILEADDLRINTVTATGNDVVVAAGGALTDDGDDATKIAGAAVSLIGASAGTADNRIDTAATSLAINATNGGIYVDEVDNVTLTDIRSAGAGNGVNLRTANNGNMIVQTLVTQGGAVDLTAGGAGSLNVTGTLESNNGVVNLTSGDVLAVPGLNTGTGSAVLHTVNDVNVGTITASQISITSDTGNVIMGTANAGAGAVSITANNGTISDNSAISLTAGQATLSARSIGSADNPLNISVDSLAANASAGGVFIDDAVGLTVTGITAAGAMNLTTSGAFMQTGSITSGGNAISVLGRSIDMDPLAIATSGGADIAYIANGADANIAVLDAASGRVLVIAADNVFDALGVNSLDNLTGSIVEIRAGGLTAGSGQIGISGSPLSIATPGGAGQTLFLVVPAANGIQRATPNVNFTGSLLLKGYTGTGGSLLFDPTTAFSAETILLGGESIVPLLNGRVAVNTDSLSAAKQALSSGVISRVNIDWAAFDPNVSLFGTLDPALRLPSDQVDDVAQ